MNGKKKEPWRIILALVSAAYIVFLWVKKDLLSVYAAAPEEQVIPMMITSVAVTMAKVALLALAIWVVKWILGKFGKK